jgi:hypothetical protein
MSRRRGRGTYAYYIVVVRTQISLQAEDHRRAKDRAARVCRYGPGRRQAFEAFR